ncbi:hypothetical protein EV714DRAFT_269229 [Schizophyllum commune]
MSYSGYAPRASSPRAEELQCLYDAYKWPSSYAYDQPPLRHAPSSSHGSLRPAVAPTGGAFPEAPEQTNFGEELRSWPAQSRDSYGLVNGVFFDGSVYPVNAQAAAAHTWQTPRSDFLADHCAPNQSSFPSWDGHNGLSPYGGSEEYWHDDTMGSITRVAGPSNGPLVGATGDIYPSNFPSSASALDPASRSSLVDPVYYTHSLHAIDEPIDPVYAGADGFMSRTSGHVDGMANVNLALGPASFVSQDHYHTDGHVAIRPGGGLFDSALVDGLVETFNNASGSSPASQFPVNMQVAADVGLDSQILIHPSFSVPFDMQTNGAHVSGLNGSADHSCSAAALESPPYTSPSPIATSSAAVTPSAMPTDPPLQVKRPTVSTDGRMRGASKRRTSLANVVCPIPSCGAVFTRNAHLKEHMQAHEDKREYICPMECCSKRGFNTYGNLKSHLQRIHKLRMQKGANGLPVYTNLQAPGHAP